jgi:hypothetical protein
LPRHLLEADDPMTEPAEPITPARRSSLGCLSAFMGLVVGLLLSLFVLVAGAWAIFEYSPFSVYSTMPGEVAIEQLALSAMNALGEEPGVEPASPAALYPIDRSVPQGLRAPLVQALDLMRAVPEGERLFNLLVENDVLISVEPMEYNAGYTATQWTRFGWRSSEIVIAGDTVRTRTVDVLAAILVHEAAHAERAISEEACFYQGDCETLPNGVQIDEELYAHRVEAAWWQAVYGDDGKDFATGTATGENALLQAYREGNAEFSRYVRKIRGDSREGSGI